MATPSVLYLSAKTLSPLRLNNPVTCDVTEGDPNQLRHLVSLTGEWERILLRYLDRFKEMAALQATGIYKILYIDDMETVNRFLGKHDPADSSACSGGSGLGSG
jgi:hypothetical protein